MSQNLASRCDSICELCTAATATIDFTVSPKFDLPENQVAFCIDCEVNLSNKDARDHWQCLTGSIWSQESAVQVLSYRILYDEGSG
ncbi:MAG: hypothetical protein ACKO7P_10705 [Bacteroidota bacterium]